MSPELAPPTASCLPLRFVRLHASAQAPRYARPGDAGLDLTTVEARTLQPGDRYLFPTGLAVEVPQGYVGLVWDRSGLGAKGLTTFGGVVDSSYRGEVKVLLYNASGEPYHVALGERIAQLLVQRVERVEPLEVGRLSPSERGSGGFGSTGR